eukprot:scaffold22790_cov42-Cyclotella_meneghiniana.AAC.3
MPSETEPIYDEESPPPAGTRFDLPEDQARRFFNTPASSAGGLRDAPRRISTDFSSTPANREQRRREQLRRQQQLQQPSILRTPGRFSTPSSTRHNRFPLPSQTTPASSSRERNQADFLDGIRVTGDSSDINADSEQQRSRTIISASPQKSKFVRQNDNTVAAVNVRVALRKEDYGEPGSSEYRKNMAAATYPLAEKFGVARHKVLSSAEDGDETKNRFVQQVLVGLTHRVKEGHERAKKYDFMDICTLADYTGDVLSSDCSAWWGNEEINIWTGWEQISETHARAWQLSINLRFSDEDLTASLWLKEFIYNSCTDSLRTAIEKKFDKIPLEQQGGITYLWYCLDEMFSMSREVRQAMLDFIALFKRRGVARYTGENVMVVEEELKCVAKRLAADGSLTQDHVIDVLTGLCICSNAKFKGIFTHLLSNAELDCLDLVLPTIPHNPTPLETLEAVLQKAYDMYDTLNIAGLWIKVSNRTSALNTIVVRRKCWNCGEEGHAVSDCTKPKDEATIKKNRDEFMRTRQSNNNSGGGRGRGNGAGRGNGGGRGRGGGRGNSDPDYQRKAWETQGIKVDSDGVLKVHCRVCGLNTTHSSRYHNAWASNPSTFRLPDNNVYVKACQSITRNLPKPPPTNPPPTPPPSQPPGQNPSGQTGSLVLDRDSLESKMSQYERTSTDPNASSIVDAFRSFLNLN